MHRYLKACLVHGLIVEPQVSATQEGDLSVLKMHLLCDIFYGAAVKKQMRGLVLYGRHLLHNRYCYGYLQMKNVPLFYHELLSKTLGVNHTCQHILFSA